MAPNTPKITLTLNKTLFDEEEVMELTLVENVNTARAFKFDDTSGASWTKISDNKKTAVFTATALKSGTVTVEMTRNWDGAVTSESVSYEVTPLSRFPGDPGKGKVRLGANNGQAGGQFTGYPIEWLDERAGGVVHSTVREYTQSMAIQSGTKAAVEKWTNEGRVTMLSFKISPYSVQDIIAGKADAEIDANAKWMAGLSGPVWPTLFHEPEDNFTSASEQDAYRKAFRHWAARTVAIAKNVAITSPMFMSYDFNPKAGRDWRVWHPNWDGSKWAYDVCHLDGLDLYNPAITPDKASARNKSWATSAGEFLNWRKKDGAKELPWVIGEHGVYTDLPGLKTDGVTATQILTDMVEVGAGNQQLVGVCMWNSNRCRFDDANDPTGEKVEVWKQIVTHSRVVNAG